jgi:SAM-dependent methyltransferase
MSINELHIKLQNHLEDQKKNWDSFIYAQKLGFYQGFDEIKIDGCRSTEKRFKNYGIDKYLSKEKIALDIGCNCGFFTLHVSKLLKRIDGIDINPYLIKIGKDTKEFLKNINTDYFCSGFEDFKSSKKYDIIFSFANDSTIDGNTKFSFNQYIEKIWNYLADDGLLIFESQAEDVVAKEEKFMPKYNLLKKKFEILEEKTIDSEYPINVPERFFLILKK